MGVLEDYCACGEKVCLKSNTRFLVNIYSPCNIEGKRFLWEDLLRLKCEMQGGDWCICEYFNAVVSRRERIGLSKRSSSSERRVFNQFIDTMELVDPLVLGKTFTWFGSDGQSMSRLDKFLLSENLMSRWKIPARCIEDRHISDHCPYWEIQQIGGLNCSNSILLVGARRT